jgi:hypothetical protein
MPNFETTTRGREVVMSRNELPPLWSPPPPLGHNGGPPLGILPNARPSRRPGRPTVSTPQLRDRIFELLWDGVPLRVMCRAEGMPSRATIYRWRQLDPAFDRKFEFCQEEGYRYLAGLVVEEIDRLLERSGPKVARLVFNLRRQQLARMNPRFFGGKDMKV